MAGVLGQKSLDQRLDLFGDSWDLGALWLRVEDGVEDVFLFGGIEGGPSEE